MKKNFSVEVHCDELKIQKAIDISKKAFIATAAEQMISYAEFLYLQSKYIKKYWWLLQGILLLILYLILSLSDSDFGIRHSLGVAAPLFVILVLPEFWKNRISDAMEVEGTTYYTIRQMYAVRLTLFAGVDMLLISAFLMASSFGTYITLWELLIQFILPFNVTCCICARCLYDSRNSSEAFSILLCSVWTGLWVLVVLSDVVYYGIAVPVWIALLVGSFLYLGYCILKGQKTIYRIWETKTLWN